MTVILVLGWPSAAHGISISLVCVDLWVGQLAEQQCLRGCIKIIGVHAGRVGVETIHGIHHLECSRRVGLAWEAGVEGVDGGWGMLWGLVGWQVWVTSFPKQPCQMDWRGQGGSKG